MTRCTIAIGKKVEGVSFGDHGMSTRRRSLMAALAHGIMLCPCLPFDYECQAFQVYSVGRMWLRACSVVSSILPGVWLAGLWENVSTVWLVATQFWRCREAALPDGCAEHAAVTMRRARVRDRDRRVNAGSTAFLFARFTHLPCWPDRLGFPSLHSLQLRLSYALAIQSQESYGHGIPPCL